MYGYLEKESPNILCGWQKRFFRVQEGNLNYFDDERDYKCKGSIDLSRVLKIGMGMANNCNSVDHTYINSELSQEFYIKLENREYQLKSACIYTTLKWVENLSKEIEKCKPIPKISGYLKKLSPRTFIGWQTRFFELENGAIRYYERNTKDCTKGIIAIDKIRRIGIGCGKSLDSGDKFSETEFFVDAEDSSKDGTRRIFRFRADSVEESRKWLERINNDIWSRKAASCC